MTIGGEIRNIHDNGTFKSYTLLFSETKKSINYFTCHPKLLKSFGLVEIYGIDLSKFQRLVL